MQNEISLSREEQMKLMENIWEKFPDGEAKKGIELFSSCFGVQYNNKLAGHKTAYVNLWNFLNKKVKEGYGFKSYIDGQKSTTFIRVNDADKLNIVKKCIVTWNQAVGKHISREELIKHFHSGWQIDSDNAYVGSIFIELCNFGYGSRYRDGKYVFFSVDRMVPIKTDSIILEKWKNKKFKRREEVAKKVLRSLNPQESEPSFSDIGEINMTKEEFQMIKASYKNLRKQLSEAKTLNAELLDQLQSVQTEIKILTEKMNTIQKPTKIEKADLSFLDIEVDSEH